MTTILETPTPVLPHTQDLPPAVLALLLHRELTRLAAILDGLPNLDETEVIPIPAGDVYRVMALGTAALPWVGRQYHQ